ncbi:MAG: hypothetical protein ACTS73_03930 [Arsenophonus sp. NEOnobi-MAG3]
MECNEKRFLDTQHQQCWVHKTANVLASLPKRHPTSKIKAKLPEVILEVAESCDAANNAIDVFLIRFSAKYSLQRYEESEKDREEHRTLWCDRSTDMPISGEVHDLSTVLYPAIC